MQPRSIVTDFKPFSSGMSFDVIYPGDLISFDFSTDFGPLSPIIFVVGKNKDKLIGYCLSYMIHKVTGKEDAFKLRGMFNSLIENWLKNAIDYNAETDNGLDIKDKITRDEKQVQNLFGFGGKIVRTLELLRKDYDMNRIRNIKSFRNSLFVNELNVESYVDALTPLSLFIESYKGSVKSTLSKKKSLFRN